MTKLPRERVREVWVASYRHHRCWCDLGLCRALCPGHDLKRLHASAASLRNDAVDLWTARASNVRGPSAPPRLRTVPADEMLSQTDRRSAASAHHGLQVPAGSGNVRLPDYPVSGMPASADVLSPFVLGDADGWSSTDGLRSIDSRARGHAFSVSFPYRSRPVLSGIDERSAGDSLPSRSPISPTKPVCYCI